MEEFIPTTFRMDVREEREAFFAQQEGKIHLHSPLVQLYTRMQRQHITGSTGFVFIQLTNMINQSVPVMHPITKRKRIVCAWQC